MLAGGDGARIVTTPPGAETDRTKTSESCSHLKYGSDKGRIKPGTK